MKKILSILFFCFFAASSYAQSNLFPTLDSLQNYIYRYVRNSTVESFTNLRLQNSLIGLSQLIDSLSGNGAVDSIWLTGGTPDTLRYRKTGTTYTVGTISGGGGGGSGTVTSFAFTNSTGITGTVANATTTPTLSLAIDSGAIANFSAKVRSLISATYPIQYTSGTGVFNLDTSAGKWRSEGYYDTKYALIGAGGGVPYTLINGGNNIGTGSEVFKDTSSNKLNFRRINGLNGITVTQNTNDISISGNADSSAARVRTGTYAQRVAITSPAVGDVFTQTDRLKGLYFFNGDTWDFQGTSLQYIYFNQFNGNTTLNAGYNTTQGAITTGAGATAPIQNASGTDGYINFQTGSTSSGVANTNFLGGNALTNMVYDSLIVYTEYKVQIPTLSDGTDRFQIAVGATTNVGSYNFPAFVFYYSDNYNSGQWGTITRAHNSGSLTIKATSVPVVAGQWVKLAIEIDSYADEIKFYIDDVLVQTHTSADNTPLNGAITWGVNSGYGHAGILKTLGTNSRSLYLNYAFAYITKRKY